MRTPAGYSFWGLAVKYTKPPLTIDAQLDLLQSRGMEIPDRVHAARYLAHINYYRLRAYWLPFETTIGSPEHCFMAGTSFDDALTLYIFDRKFRLLVLEAIERIEISFRTQFAYVLSLKYGSHAFLDEILFKNTAFHRQLIQSLKEEIDRSTETFIEHYRSKYDDPTLPPIWAVCEVMSFGQLSKWFQSLKLRQDRLAISRTYGLDESVLGSFMHHLTHVRNLTAHHSRLWNRRLTFTMTIPKQPTHLRPMFNLANDRYIFNTLVMLGYLLQIISPGSSWPQRIRQLIESTPDVKTAAMGFPDKWWDLPPWRTAT
jgi:abortive infection bacteriophage resistance protein